MLPVRQTVTGIGVSAPIPIDRYRNPSTAAIGCVVSAGATVSYTVEYTYDDVFASTFNPSTAMWFPHPTLTTKTASADGNLAYPATAIRLNVASSNGTVTMTFVQAGI